MAFHLPRPAVQNSGAGMPVVAHTRSDFQLQCSRCQRSLKHIIARYAGHDFSSQCFAICVSPGLLPLVKIAQNADTGLAAGAFCCRGNLLPIFGDRCRPLHLQHTSLHLLRGPRPDSHNFISSTCITSYHLHVPPQGKGAIYASTVFTSDSREVDNQCLVKEQVIQAPRPLIRLTCQH